MGSRWMGERPPGAPGRCGFAEARRDGVLVWRGTLSYSCLGPSATSQERPHGHSARLGCPNLRALPLTHPLLWDLLPFPRGTVLLCVSCSVLLLPSSLLHLLSV